MQTDGDHGDATSHDDNRLDVPAVVRAMDARFSSLPSSRMTRTRRYQTLSSRDEAEERSLAHAHLRNCNLCPRLRGVNRYEKTGLCLIGDKAKAKANVTAPHFGEGGISVPENAMHLVSPHKTS
ncbi:pyruvate formate lyase activating enzyme [Metarhizium album ARSEF 1941]|uniref:Pyruvate formate lyase activating enzyme n=1 Tax=Metarhizium album (strain ARSEF 1941) TaxID=1081103 RepID=A0A0B2WUR5_METAS|nr:pyruvate formate lyase activating enzyme [Metarhizium album ARSEF 1941]KHN99786.1 pyruvate formate lyase activating enzyme [Metarhizium album ARSEF 1941]